MRRCRDNFLKNDRQLHQLNRKITNAVNDDIGKLFEDYDNLAISVSGARQKASFALGYATALRLLGVTPKATKKTVKGRRR